MTFLGQRSWGSDGSIPHCSLLSDVIRVVGTVAFDTVGLVRSLPSPDTTARVRHVETRFGGTAGNVAVALARLGGRPSLAAAVGPDFPGSAYERRLLDLGVDVRDVVVVEEPTSHAYIWSDDAGHQATFFHPGASGQLARAPVRKAAVAHFGAGEMTAYVPHMEAADLVTYDPGQEVFHRPLPEVVAQFPHVDVLFLNRHEAARLADGTGFGPARAFELGMRALVLSKGSDGCDIVTPDGQEHVPVVPARAVDPTGAGDAHRAGFVLGLSRGLPLALCGRIGAVAAAFAVEQVGPQEGAFSLDSFRERYAAAFGACPL